VISTATNTVTATVPVGHNPDGVAVSPDGSAAYVTNDFNDTVSVIGTAAETVTATIGVGVGPEGVAVFTLPSAAPPDVTAASVGTVDVTVTTSVGTSAASAADHYSYVYPFTGFQSPVNNLPTLNQVNRGQAIPMRFSLGGNQGLNIIAAGYPTVTQINCSTSAPVSTGTMADTAGGSGLQYDSSTGTYTYVWKTSKAWAVTCQQFNLTLNDGSSHLAIFQFK
jgi:YVTN family beta-propeller protein